MSEKRRPKSVTALSILLAGTAAGTAAFWILFFAGKIKATETEQDEAFEKAFPLADSWMIACALVASRNLLKVNLKGMYAGAAAGSALVFLACMDILYSLQNGKYWPLDADRVQMLAIHLWTATLGGASIGVLWRNRKAFTADRRFTDGT